MPKGNIDILFNHIEVYPYELGQSSKIERMLSKWDSVTFKAIPIAFHYDGDSKKLYLPRNLSEYLLQKEFPYYKINMTTKPSDFDSILALKLNIMPRDDKQKESIAFILGEKEYHYTKNHSQLFLNLETGEGKTYCAIASISIFRMKTIIIVNDKKIRSQWYESLIKFTNLTEHDVCVIDGGKDVGKILSDPSKYKNKRVFVVIHRTINSYARSNGWHSISALFQTLKIGMTIVDEAHKEFANTMMISFFTNVKKTIYLTASIGRSEISENKIYRKVFDDVPLFGDKFKTDESKYIKMSIFLYDSKPNYQDQGNCQTRLGFSLNNYMDYCMDKGKKKFFKVLVEILNLYMKHDGKIAILVGKISTALEVKKVLQDLYKINVGNYTSHIKTHDEKEKELDNKIIVSTSKSLGVGTDIKDLRFLIMTEPYSSEIMAKQVPGRLRRRENDEVVMYSEMVDIGFFKIKKQYSSRKDILRKKALKFIEVNVDD